jgi:hypothetical protein
VVHWLYKYVGNENENEKKKKEQHPKAKQREESPDRHVKSLSFSLLNK